jgi:hypothetical protein
MSNGFLKLKITLLFVKITAICNWQMTIIKYFAFMACVDLLYH